MEGEHFLLLQLPAMSRRHMLVIERVERSRLEQAATTPRIGARSAMDICIASAFAMVAENVYRSGKKKIVQFRRLQCLVIWYMP